MRSSWRAAQERRSSTFFCSKAKKDSMAALSPAAPTRPIDPVSWWRSRAWTNFRLRNCDPRMLSCVSSRDLRVSRFGDWVGLAGVEQVVDLADEVALEAADDLHLGVAFGGLLCDVALGARVQPHAADHGQVQRGVPL